MIPKKVRNRATKALKRAARDLLKPKKHQKCTCSCPIIEQKSKDKTSEPPATNLTPELKHASIQGWKMMRDVFFPAIPALLQDIWVYTELGISLFAFIFGLLDLFPIEDNAAFQIVYLVLTIISIILALIDANIYFFQLGSCVRAYRTCRIYIETHKNETSSELVQGESKDDLECNNTAEEDEKLAWYRLSTKWKERLTTWFDLIRTIASELLLYPLVIFDLFDFVTGAGYRAHSADDRVNFSLFVVGGFYLILAVYIMRIFMVAGALSSLVKIPLIKRPSSGDGGNHIDMIVKFCIHLIGQIVVHLMILVVIGAKIANENIDSEMMLQINTSNASNSSGSGLGDQANTIRASAFLAVAIVLGSVIPLIGIIMFFVANYYWMQEFSIVLWVDMVSLLQGQGFAETVFGGEGTAPSNELAQSFAKNTSYSTVKKQLRRFKSPPFYRKFLHPARVPLAGISCFIYGATLVIFIFSLALTTDENGIVLVAVFKNDNILTVSFVIITLCVVMANIHVLVLFAIGMVVLLLIGVIAIPTITLLTFVVIFIYVPLLSYYLVRNMVLDRQSSRKASAFEMQGKNELDSITNDSGHNSSKTKTLEQVVITAT